MFPLPLSVFIDKKAGQNTMKGMFRQRKGGMCRGTVYAQDQWVLLFFLYSVLGWVWESCYVSLKSRQWVNRGFLHGPWLPIYGSGAIVILLLTLPARGRPALIFLLGMVGATVLEYVTGAVMERLFHMRYWDYSDKPLNVNGHICLPVSIAWGGFSLLLIYLLHPPVEDLVFWLPGAVTEKGMPVSGGSFRRGHGPVGPEGPGPQGAAHQPQRHQPAPAGSGRKAQVRRWTTGHGAGGRPALPVLGAWPPGAGVPPGLSAAQTGGAPGPDLPPAGQPGSEEPGRSGQGGPAPGRRFGGPGAPAPGGPACLLDGRGRGHPQDPEEVYARRTRDFQRAVDLLYRNPSATSRHHVKAFQTLSALKQRREGKK